MNQFIQLPSESRESRLAQVQPNEASHHGWPGDGSGEDDLADHNANEADDYRNEGGEDSYLDTFWESQNEVDFCE